MIREIFLANYAKKQLDDQSNRRWDAPIEFRREAQKGFCYKIFLTDEDMMMTPVEGNCFYPDRSEYMDEIMDRLHRVRPSKNPAPHQGVQLGDRVKTFFHLDGEVSSKELEVAKLGRQYIHLRDGAKLWKFDKDTGKCCNDGNVKGCRTIDNLL